MRVGMGSGGAIAFMSISTCQRLLQDLGFVQKYRSYCRWEMAGRSEMVGGPTFSLQRVAVGHRKSERAPCKATEGETRPL
jgi:hypothetical protein